MFPFVKSPSKYAPSPLGSQYPPGFVAEQVPGARLQNVVMPSAHGQSLKHFGCDRQSPGQNPGPQHAGSVSAPVHVPSPQKSGVGGSPVELVPLVLASPVDVDSGSPVDDPSLVLVLAPPKVAARRRVHVGDIEPQALWCRRGLARDLNAGSSEISAARSASRITCRENKCHHKRSHAVTLHPRSLRDT